MDSILSVLTNSQTELAVIKIEENDSSYDCCNINTLTGCETACYVKNVKNPDVTSKSDTYVKRSDFTLSNNVEENIADIKKEISDGLAENEINITDITIKQQIVKESSNPSLLWFVTKNEPNVHKQKRRKSAPRNFKTRKKIHSETAIYKCEVCSKVFSKHMYLVSHSIKHTNLRLLNCSNCQQTFKHKASLTLHMKTHLQNEDSNCAACQRFKCSKHDKAQLLKYKCITCDKSFQTKQSYEAHCFMHNGQRPYKCKLCPKSFLYKHTLNSHTLGHNKIKKDKKYKCDKCSKCYEYKSELSRHYAHHSNTHAWLCTVCGKTYALQATLKTHLKTHDPNKAYECDTCGSTFMKRSILEVHIKKVHNLESPSFMCDRCPKQFYSSDGLKQHMVIHVNDKKFVCDMCFKLFLNKSRYSAHRRKIHKLDT